MKMNKIANAALALTLLLCSVLVGSPAAAAGLQTQAEIEAMVAELIPVVEEQAGRHFTSIPPVVIATPDDMAQVLYAEQLYLLTQVSGVPLPQAQRAARATSAELSEAFAGKYGFLDKRLYIMTQGINQALAQRGAPPELVRPVFEIVVAHELVHALQDQQADLATAPQPG